MKNSIWIYILIMAGVTYLIRVLPLVLLRKPITNRFIRSFLYYVPYVTLSVMTFPAIVQATRSPIAGAAAIVIGVIAAFKNGNLIIVAGASCATVLAAEAILSLFGL